MPITPDLIVVGAGIVGLAHALGAAERGMSVTVLERDDRPVGASVRNFGHGCITAQTGDALDFAERARPTWLRLAGAAGFTVDECGTVIVARAEEEVAALEEFAQVRGDDVVLLDPAGVLDRIPVEETGLLGGAFLPRDIRIDQRSAAPAIAAWLAARAGVDIHWGTAVFGVEEGLVRTGRGDLEADRIIVCVGHDLDRLAPHVADAAGLRRCELQMLQVRAPGRPRIGPAVLTGSSMLRYSALAATSGATALRERWSAERPELLANVVNHMFTQLPDGDLVVGDTHHYARTLDPFERTNSEDLDDLLLAETKTLLGRADLQVVHRWRGVYADAEGEFLHAELAPGAVAVSVTSGIGMTTALGLAPSSLDALQSRATGPADTDRTTAPAG